MNMATRMLDNYRETHWLPDRGTSNDRHLSHCLGFCRPPCCSCRIGPHSPGRHKAASSNVVTAWQRLQWFDEKTFGVSNLAGSLPGTAVQTLLDRPHEAGPHWEGFGERYGVSVSTNAVSNTMEAGLGAIWGEDPRYLRDGAGVPFKSRLGHIVQWTVVAPNRNGDLMPAYARFIGISGSSLISNAWREPSDTSASHTLGRIGFGLLGRMGSNAFDEFWPDTKRKLFHRSPRD
jgi:hypothetical protein